MPWLFQIVIPDNPMASRCGAGGHLDIGRWLGIEHIDADGEWSTLVLAWRGAPRSWAAGGAPWRQVTTAWRTTPQRGQRADHLDRGQQVEHLGRGWRVEHLYVGDDSLTSNGSDDNKDKTHLLASLQ
jgi:hypothetical protein